MKIKSTAQLFGVGLGTALGSLALMSTPVFSATLGFFGTDEDAFVNEICTKSFDDPIPDDCKTRLKIGEVQGFSRSNPSDPEKSEANPQGLDSIYFGKDGSNSLITGLPLESEIFIWKSEMSAEWELDWNPTTEKATFTIKYSSGEKSLSYDYSEAITEFKTFNSLALITFVKPGQIKPSISNVTSKLAISKATFSNGESQDSFTTNEVTSTSQYDKLFFILDDSSLTEDVNITNLKGTYTMSWDGSLDTPGQQAAGFYLQMYDPKSIELASASTTTPEPGLMLGLLGVGTLGLVGRKRKIETK